jgi:ribosome-associated protein
MPRPARTDELNHETFPAISTSDPAVTLSFAVAAAQSLSDDKCDDVIILDVRELSQVTDYIVIGTGTSDRQMHSALTSIEGIGRAQGFPVFRSSDDDRATWLLADFVDVVVHVFEPNTRAHYDLEMLWGDAVRVPWERTEPRPRRRPGQKEGGTAS